MKRLITVVAAVAMSVQFGTARLDACGAKFLVATGSAFLQRLLRTRHPANILLYQHTRDKEVVEFVTKLRGMLRDMGHQVTVADGEAALRDASGGKFNIVILKLDEARRLKASVAAGLPDAAILPMEALVTQP